MSIPARKIIREINNPKSPANALSIIALTAASALVNPRKLRPGTKALFRLSQGAIAAWITWTSIAPGLRRTPIYPAIPAAAAIAAGGVTLGLMDPSEKIDGKIHDALLRRGLKKPRIVMAAASGALSALASASNLIGTDDLDYEKIFDYNQNALFEAEQQQEVPQQLRELLNAILKAQDGFGAPTIRHQLAEAKCTIFAPDPDWAWPFISFEIPDAAAAVIPQSQTFPVLARLRYNDTFQFDLRLIIENGKLTTVALEAVAEEGGDEELELIDEQWLHYWNTSPDFMPWPPASEVEIMIETPEGISKLK